MARFPSARLTTYESGALSNDALSSFGYLNLPKDLSLLNRRGYASTTRKGVPLVYRVKLDLYAMNFGGQGVAYDTSSDGVSDTSVEGIPASDFYTMLSVNTCQNNWVLRNAAVKFHAARDKMWKKAGVKRSHLGAYAHEIRYNFDTNGQTWMTPKDGAGDDFAGGTWDHTELVTESDSSGFFLKLVGTGLNESNDNTATALSIGHSYLASRSTVPADSNLESSVVPADFSVLNELLRDVQTSGVDDNIIDDVQAQGDNPPYDEFVPSDTNHDITEPVEAARIVSSVGSGVGSAIVDIPFGLANLKARHYNATDQAITQPVTVKCEVLDIFEMQG